MTQSNFQFLKDQAPDLFELGCQAEGWIYSDPESAVVCLYQMAELMLYALYRDLELSAQPNDTFFSLLVNECFEESVDQVVIARFHQVRSKAESVLGMNGTSPREAILALEVAYELTCWFYVALKDGDYTDCGHFHVPDIQGALQFGLEQVVQQSSAAFGASVATLHAIRDEYRQSSHSGQWLRERHAEKPAANVQAGEPVRDTLESVYKNYSLTMDQSLAVRALEDFMKSKRVQALRLMGSAGTGKTFILKGLVEYLTAKGQAVQLLAPTGKAARVLSSMTGVSATTIHSAIYATNTLETDFVTTEDGKKYKQPYFPIEPQCLSDAVYIVDESSMLSNQYSVAHPFRFGSGLLLDDLIECMALKGKRSNKVIFVGDLAQLPPVKMNRSPALSGSYLQERYDLASDKIELKTVVRQNTDSGILRAVNRLRDNILSENYSRLSLDEERDIDCISPDELVPTYLKACNYQVSKEAVLLAYRNADVLHYNLKIREELFPGCKELAVSDKLLVVNNTKLENFILFNGDFVQVRELGYSEQKTITVRHKQANSNYVVKRQVVLSYRWATVAFRMPDGAVRKSQVLILENLLGSPKGSISSLERQAVYVDFCQRHKGLKKNSDAFYKAMEKDPYFNALQVKFGYAMTVHKAQGSEWNQVVIDCFSPFAQDQSGYFRWLYTAMSRARSQLYLASQPRIGLSKEGGFHAAL